MPDVADDVIARLRSEWSLDFARVRRVLAAFAGGAPLSELVAASGLPRRDVESIIADLDQRSLVADIRDGGTQVVIDEPELEARMTELAAGLPPSRWRLDHVPATPETMARRAQHLANEYELGGASVLCLGDHDLTSLAVGSVVPDAELTVVDIDEPILDHVAASAERLGFPLTAAWADLRLTLPPSLTGTADLVFTDPPYTTEGMCLFLMRALEALRPTGHERLVFCFGTGERHLVKALEVQALLGDLRLALEAMLPGFNRYDGAEAIGSRSDLYICRPTKGAKVGEPAPSARSARSRRPTRAKAPAARIYTRGPAAEEAPAYSVPEQVRTAALAAAGEGPVLLVGDGLDDTAVELPEFFRRVAMWATAARPGPFPFTGTPVINTSPSYGSAAIRTLLLAAPDRAVLIGPRRDLVATGLLPTADQADDLIGRPLSVAYDLAAVPTGPGGDPAVVVATRNTRPAADTAEAVLRHILLRPGAKVVNAWRDGLLAVAREAGQPMTKNEARAHIAADSLPASLSRLRTWELPLAALRALAAEIARSTAVP
ncbi:MAG TPA: bis-aminopropyl spermidine synthase family protein [Acidimicrobiia bacterium]|nr:bis-aminopropyl spermidine synthase family protein [Acidimicrobiia bacterium]